MTRFLVTAAALTLGTSALAWAPAETGAPLPVNDAKFATSSKVLTDSKLDAGTKTTADKIGIPTENKGMAKIATAIEADGSKAQLAAMDVDAKSDMKLDSSGAEFSTLAKLDDGKGQSVTAGMKPVTAEIQSASWKDVEDSAMASVDGKAETGMGGPLEEVGTKQTAASTGYPACDPGPGDDNCIQLYEPGVLPALAAWKGSSDVAMGGPFEAADGDAKPAGEELAAGEAKNEADGDAHSGPDMTADDTVAKPEATAATGTSPSKIAGSTAATDYPPCRSRADDRCTQVN